MLINKNSKKQYTIRRSGTNNTKAPNNQIRRGGFAIQQIAFVPYF